MITDVFQNLFGNHRSKKAHDIKNQITRDMLEVHRRLKETTEYIEQTTAYRIAKATGRVRK